MSIKRIVKENKILFGIAIFMLNLRKRVLSKQIKGKNNRIENAAVTSKIKYEIYGDNNIVTFARGARITNNSIFISGSNNRIAIGSNVIYKSGSIWIEGDHCSLEIGSSTTIEGAHFLITGNEKSISVGSDCLFSTNIVLRTGDSHSIIDAVTNERINYEKSISIGNHIWIGADVRVLKGVTIEDNSIIGNGSIVTKNIPSGVVAAGIPAKVSKTNINWLRERI